EGAGLAVEAEDVAVDGQVDVLVDDQEVVAVVEDQPARPGQAAAVGRDEGALKGAGAGVEPGDAVVLGVADVQGVRRGGRDGPLLQRLQRRAGAAGALPGGAGGQGTQPGDELHERLLATVCGQWEGHQPGAQTERRGDAGPVRSLPGRPTRLVCLWFIVASL